jgi:signal transduction histidine kinase
MASVATRYLRFAPELLERLGEELVAHPEQGIIELVRNAYDADARKCVIEITGAGKNRQRVRISDDGFGMSLDEITSAWLVLGRSRKSAQTRSPSGRYVVGDKGLGRLAALRLGRQARLITRPQTEPGVEYSLLISWPEFNEAEVVEEVPLTVTTSPTSASPGSTIELDGVALKRDEIRRLTRSLILLCDPFDTRRDFFPVLESPEFDEQARFVHNDYFDVAQYHLLAQLDAGGRASARIEDNKRVVKWVGDHRQISKAGPTYHAPSSTFELWTFILTPTGLFSRRRATVGSVREWLSTVGGVHVYHRGLRVHPYGDRGHDWLDMNLARARSPEERPSTNTSIGRVLVADPDGSLLQKTDRTGFVENDVFLELRRFATDVLEWMARERLRAIEARRQRRRRSAPEHIARAQQSLKETVTQLPLADKQTTELTKAIERYQRAQDREATALREEVQLYRTLSTIGTTMAVFAHEAAGPIARVSRIAEQIQTRAKAILGVSEYEAKLSSLVRKLEGCAATLKPGAELTLDLLQRHRRKPGSIDVKAVIEQTVRLFTPFLDEAAIHVSVQVEDKLIIDGVEASVQVILANLVTNATKALAFTNDGDLLHDAHAVGGEERAIAYEAGDEDDVREGERDDEERLLSITAVAKGDVVVIRVMDSGPGIVDMAIDSIWLPGESRFAKGTGLGLTIVRDTVLDLGGKIHAIPNGELGGAEFVIEIPAKVS